MISKVFHLLMTAYYFFVAVYSFTQLDFSKATHPDLLTLKKFHFRYFTGWNIVLQCLCFSICVFDDVVSFTPASFLAKFKSKLRSWKSYMFLALSFPATMLVAFVFWSHYTFDRELIYPMIVDSVIPLWLNHAMHTGIVLTAALELALAPHSCSRRQGIVGINIYLGIYETCLLSTFFMHDIWLYPVFKMLTLPQIVGFGVGLHVIGTGFFLLGSSVSTWLWRKTVKKLNKQSSKQQAKPQTKQQKQKSKPKQSPQPKQQSPQQPKQQSPQQPKEQSPKQPKQVTKQQSTQQTKPSPQTTKQVAKQQSPKQPKEQSKQNGNSVLSKKKEKMK